MINISNNKLEKFLGLYKPEFRFLVYAISNYPSAEGMFNIPATYYTQQPLKHVTSIEAQLCLNQLTYAAFGEWITNNRHFTMPPIGLQEYLDLMKEHMVITESNIRFRRPIETGKTISGTIKLDRNKRHGNLYVARLDYSLSNGNSEGKLEVALKL